VLYLHDMLSDVTRPEHELTGFKRRDAPARPAAFPSPFPLTQLGFFDRAMRISYNPAGLGSWLGALR
jgi:hypothetical protein